MFFLEPLMDSFEPLNVGTQVDCSIIVQLQLAIKTHFVTLYPIFYKVDNLSVSSERSHCSWS
jgi:hypothetical protein